MQDETESLAAPLKSERKKPGRKPGSSNKPKVDAASILHSPEGKKLFAEALEKATADILARLSEKRGEDAPKSTSADDSSFARHLATEFAALADQGTGKTKRLPAAEVEKRANARAEMEDAILDAEVGDDPPEYELSRAVYFDEQVVPPTYVDPYSHRLLRTRIAWPGVPNEGMSPLNAPAKRIFSAFMRSIGGATPMVKAQTETIRPLENKGKLSVLHKQDMEGDAPEVGAPRGGRMQVLRKAVPDEVLDVRVLGTVAPHARQMT